MEVNREEAKRILRRLELEAYSSIVSTFRAQGDLNREKKKLLTDLGVHLSISTERHRAEVRRAYSDDRLGSVAECIVGPSTSSEWAAEGKRLVPLMPRLVPQTVLSGTATASANAAAAANAQIAQAKKLAGATSQAAKDKASTSVKLSSGKPLARQISETVDVEYDSDDSNNRKKRRLSQSITSTKPVQKISLNPSVIGIKPAGKAASVSTSTMTKVGKPSTSAGTVKSTQKLVLPASQSQVKLLTKTVSITQNQAKTMLNYKTVAATNPVKVQTVTSHGTPKSQVKMTVPPKNILVPKASASTSPTKAATSISQLKTGIAMSQLAAKQRGKQPAKFKPLPGAVKYKSVNALAMGLPSTPVTMATSNISTLTGSTISTVSSTQPVVRVIQVPGAVGTTTIKAVQPTGALKPPPALPISGSSTIAKIPIVSSQSSVAKLASTTSTLPSAAKTVVMTTIVGGTKKVVLSVPAPITPVQAVPTKVTKPSKTTGLTTQQVLSTGDSNTKLIPDKQDAAVKIVKVPSLECTEPNNVLQAPVPIVPKQSPAQVVPSQVRSRPLQTLLPAPPKPAIVTAATTLSGNTVVRKLPQILPAPAKTTVMIPVTKPATIQAVTTATMSSAGKVPLVQFMAKTTQPSVVTKLCVSKTVPVVTSRVSPAIRTLLTPPAQPKAGTSQAVPVTSLSTTVKYDTSLTALGIESDAGNKDRTGKDKFNSDIENKEALECDDNKADSNTSSEDDSLLVCSETIDSGAGLPDTTHEVISDLPETSIHEVTSDVTLIGSSVDVLAMSTPLKKTDQFDMLKDELVISTTIENKDRSLVEKDTLVTPTKSFSDDPKVVVEMLDSVEVKTVQTDENEKQEIENVVMDIKVNVDEQVDFEKVTTGEDFDAVSSFVQTFGRDQTINDTKVEKEWNKTNKNTSTIMVNSVTERKNKDILDTDKHEKGLSLHRSDEKTKTISPELPTSSRSILSAFDVFDTPMVESQAEKVSSNTSAPKTVTSSAIISTSSVLKNPLDAPNNTTNTIHQGFNSHPLADCNVTVQSLKECTQKSINENSSNSSTHAQQNTNILAGNSREISQTSSANLGWSSNKFQADSSEMNCTSLGLIGNNSQADSTEITPTSSSSLDLIGNDCKTDSIEINRTSSASLGSIGNDFKADSTEISPTSSASLGLISNMSQADSTEINRTSSASLGSIGNEYKADSTKFNCTSSASLGLIGSDCKVDSTDINRTNTASLDLIGNESQAVSSGDGLELTESERLALEAIANVRTSSRKRKPPSVLTLSPPRQTSGWVRGALSLLQKVCSYRGQGRKKGDYSAASWFLRPVDPNEAPGYFKVIKNPMDLGTIKTKLENGVYQDYTEFYDDMVLIKNNCFKYNPAGHDIWKDCEEVFNYFDSEYEKMLERWEKCHVSPAKKPRTMPKQELTSSVSW